MQIRWSPEAADDFESAIRRILQDNPSNAQRVAQIIYDRIACQPPNVGAALFIPTKLRQRDANNPGADKEPFRLFPVSLPK